MEVRTPPNSPHYAKLVCNDCDKWIKWLPNPALNLVHDIRSQQIEKLLISNAITENERGFLVNIRNARLLTDRQKGWLDSILNRVLQEVSPTQP